MNRFKRNQLMSEIFISYILKNNKARAVGYIRQLDAEGRRDVQNWNLVRLVGRMTGRKKYKHNGPASAPTPNGPYT